MPQAIRDFLARKPQKVFLFFLADLNLDRKMGISGGLKFRPV